LRCKPYNLKTDVTTFVVTTQHKTQHMWMKQRDSEWLLTQWAL